MAVVDYNDNMWFNNDDLAVYFPQDSARPSRGGEYSMLADGRHCVQVTIHLATLPTVVSTNDIIVAENVTIPAGALIEQVDVLVTKQGVGSGANLDLGLVDASDRTLVDADGLLAKADEWHAESGDLGKLISYRKGTTEAGDKIGAILQQTSLICASPDTADFTDGVIKVRIYYSIPSPDDL